MTLADLFNVETELPFRGQVFKLRKPTQLEQAQYQRWLETRAREALGRATDLPEEMQRSLARDVNADIAAGVYEWGGEVCARSLRTPTGLAKLLAIILADQGITHDNAVEMVAERIHEIAAVLISKVTEDPKALAATLKTLGLPSTYLSSDFSTRRSTKRSKRSASSPTISSCTATALNETSTDTPN